MTKRPRSRLKRILGGLAIGLVLLLIVLTPIVSWRLGPIVRQAAETFGPRFLGVTVQVEHVNIKPWRGIAEIRGVALGNPEGFQSPHMFELGELRVVLSLASLRTDTLVIRELLIREPRVTYELRGRRTNIGTMLAGLEAQAEAQKKTDKGPERKVIVDHFRFESGRLGFSTLLTAGRAVVVPLPVIDLRDVGRRSGGLAAADLTLQIVTSIATSVGRGVIEASGQLVGDGAELLKQAASGGAGAVLGVAGGAAGLAGDAAGAVGGVIGGAGRTAAEGVGRTVGGAVGAVGGLLGRQREAKEDDAPAVTAPDATTED